MEMKLSRQIWFANDVCHINTAPVSFNTSSAGIKSNSGRQIQQFFTSTSPHLQNDGRQGHSYHYLLIGSRTCAFLW